MAYVSDLKKITMQTTEEDCHIGNDGCAVQLNKKEVLTACCAGPKNICSIREVPETRILHGV